MDYHRHSLDKCVMLKSILQLNITTLIDLVILWYRRDPRVVKAIDDCCSKKNQNEKFYNGYKT